LSSDIPSGVSELHRSPSMKTFIVTLIVVIVAAVGVIIGVLSKSDTSIVCRNVDGIPVVEVGGTLDRGGARQIEKAIGRAARDGASTIVFCFDSPGGEISATLDAAEAIAASRLRTVCLVKEGGGGTVFLVAATDRIYFAPAGVFGSLPVTLATSDASLEDMRRKLTAYFISEVKRLAEAKGHDSEVFVAMIDQESELVRGSNVWKGRGQLLSLTANEAEVIGLSSGTVSSIEDLVSIQKMESGEPVATANPDSAG
jgi:membrane-bound serine protease (ClpP class)